MLDCFGGNPRKIKVKTDSHFDFGAALGGKNQANIKAILALTMSRWSHSLLASFCLEKAQKILSVFPDWQMELKGLAQGAGVRFSEVVLLNFFEDWVWGRTVEHCSLIFQKIGQQALIGWNEDGPKENLGRMVLVDGQFGDLRFLTLQYPGLSCGDTLALTSSGLVIAWQNLYASEAKEKQPRLTPGLPKGLVGRKLLEARTLSETREMVSFLSQFGFAQGFHLFVYDWRRREILSLEMEAGEKNPRLWLRSFENPETFVHTNHYLWPDDQPEDEKRETISADSLSRFVFLEKCAKELCLFPDRLGEIMAGREAPAKLFPETEICRRGKTATLHSQVIRLTADSQRPVIWTSPASPFSCPFKKWRSERFH